MADIQYMAYKLVRYSSETVTRLLCVTLVEKAKHFTTLYTTWTSHHIQTGV